MKWTDKNIIFLISLPRAGSTLLQRVLTAHPSICSASESWLLLPQFYSLERGKAYAEYSHMAASAAIADFCDLLPEKKLTYYSAIKDFTVPLFQMVSTEPAIYFLEKTPRNALILDKLIETFPQSKFIFLWRNPLASAASMIETFSQGKWNLHRHYIDLYDGLNNMVNTFDTKNNNIHSLRYEDLIAEPEHSIKQLFKFLDVEFYDEAIKDFTSVQFSGRMGDPTGIKQYNSISKDSLDKWQTTLANPLRRKWANEYLKWIGSSRLDRMGYDFDQLSDQLKQAPFSLDNTAGDLLYMSFGALNRRFHLRMLRQRFSNKQNNRQYEIF